MTKRPSDHIYNGSMDEAEFAEQRQYMVRDQLQARGIRAARVLAACASVPRHRFVPPQHREWAYADSPLAIGHDQTISQPYMVALMTEALALRGPERVLDIGTGSGYQAAVLAQLAAEVHTVEIIPELAAQARCTFMELGLTNITVHVGDGSAGWAASAPYAGIMVAAAAPAVPHPLLNQLNEGGRLVVPVGARRQQTVQVWQRVGQQFHHRELVPALFVPLRGAHGWPPEP